MDIRDTIQWRSIDCRCVGSRWSTENTPGMLVNCTGTGWSAIDWSCATSTMQAWALLLGLWSVSLSAGEPLVVSPHSVMVFLTGRRALRARWCDASFLSLFCLFALYIPHSVIRVLTQGICLLEPWVVMVRAEYEVQRISPYRCLALDASILLGTSYSRATICMHPDYHLSRGSSLSGWYAICMHSDLTGWSAAKCR